MASFTAGTTFTDGVANDVTAAKLGALVTNATPTSGFIQDRTAETVTATNDTLLIGDASDSNNLKRITVANFAQTLPTAKITTGTIETGTFGTTTSTAESVTTGTITTLTAGTTTSTAATITTGTIPTLVATTLITSGTGTAAAPAIVPTGDTNNGLFFPAADNIAVSTNGTERVRVDSSGNVGIGTTSPSQKLEVSGPTNIDIIAKVNASGTGSGFVQFGNSTVLGEIAGYSDGAIGLNHTGVAAKVLNSIRSGAVSNTLVLNAGNVGIGTTSPSTKLNVNAGRTTLSANNENFALQLNYGSTANGCFLGSSGADTFLISSSGGAERLRIDSSGNVLVTNAAGLGYGTGAGGTVTQGTSKTTGVTLNKPTGQITMNNAALAANASVIFTLTNSLIANTDTLSVNHSSAGGTTSAYQIVPLTCAAGSATIRVTNITAGSLSEALVLNFNVIKGATS